MVNLWIGFRAVFQGTGQFNLLDRAEALLSIPVHFTGSAVMLFFVISGFCIHYPYAAGKRALQFKSYAVRRLLRIYPAYLVTVGFCLLVEALLQRAGAGGASPLTKVLSTAFMVQNYGAQAGQMVSNPALWSLPVEMEFYLLYPVFLCSFRCLGAGYTMAAVGLVSACALALTLSGVTWTGANFALYWVIWCGGAWLAEAVRQDKLPLWRWQLWLLVGVAGFAGIYGRLVNLPFAIQNMLWSVPYFFIVWWGLSRRENSLWLKNSRWRIFLFLGTISYSLYLIHFPFFMLCGLGWAAFFGGKPWSFLVPLLFSALAVLPAYVLYKFVESPSHNLGRKLGADWEKGNV